MATLSAVVMPKWGMEMTEGELAEWHVAVGDQLAANADVVDVETAKIVNTVTASAAGTVVRLCASVGDVVPVGGLLAVVADGAADEAEIDAFVGGLGGSGAAPAPEEAPANAAPAPATASDTTTAPAPAAAPAPTTSKLSEGPDDSDVPASPVARRIAAKSGINLHNVTASGRHGRVSLDDLRQAAAGANLDLQLPAAREFDGHSADDSEVNATPVARRLAAKLGVNLNDCRNTGRHGRVSKADVEAAAAKRGTAAPAAAPASAPATTPSSRVDDVSQQTLAGARKTIARVVAKAKQEVPHFRVNIDVNVDEAMALRRMLNARRSDVKVSLNDILIRACASALENHPRLNARFDGETLEQHSQAHIASAVAAENGVLMPVLRDAGSLGLAATSTAMRDLATRAKTGRLAMDEMDGATFSISNLGMFGIDSFDAIINQPAVAILAVGAAEQRPIVRDGELTSGLIMKLSLSSDHRVVDGADAAQFLAELKALLETPAMMLG